MLVLGQIRQRQFKTLGEIEAPLGDVLAEDAEDVFETNPVMSIGRANELNATLLPEGSFANAPIGIYGDPSLEPLESEALTAEQGRQKVAEAGIEGELEIPERGIPSLALDILIRRKKEELQRQSVQSRAPSGFGASLARLGVGLGVSLADPINVGLGFFPVIAGARYASWLAGKTGAARFGTRAGVGALEGAAGALAIEPVILGATALEQRDYGLLDSFMNVVFGTAIGGGLHSFGGAIGDFRASRGNPVTSLPTEAKQVVLAEAVGARVEGAPVRAAETLEALAKESPAVARVVERARTQGALAEAERTATTQGDDMSDPRVADALSREARGERVFPTERLTELEGNAARIDEMERELSAAGVAARERTAEQALREGRPDAGRDAGRAAAGREIRAVELSRSEAAALVRSRGGRLNGSDFERFAEEYYAAGVGKVGPERRAALETVIDKWSGPVEQADQAARATIERAAGRNEATTQRLGDDFRSEEQAPEWTELSREADELAAKVPTTAEARLAKAEEELALSEEELKALMDAGAIDEADARMMKSVDEALAMSRAYGKAAKEGALCMSRNGAGEA